jgi:hypothetical protein
MKGDFNNEEKGRIIARAEQVLVELIKVDRITGTDPRAYEQVVRSSFDVSEAFERERRARLKGD